MSSVEKRIRGILKKIYLEVFRTRVLMFHHVQSNPDIKRSGCVLDTRKFKEIVRLQKRCVSLREIVNTTRLGLRNRTAITFDDGLADVYSIAYPFLKKLNIPFTVFILTGLLDTEGYLTTNQLIELSRDPLVEIGCHGTQHRILTTCNDAELHEEIKESKVILESIINKPVDFFAYSHGAYDKEIIELVKESGYIGACSVIGLPYAGFYIKRRYEIPRMNIEDATLT